MHSTHIIKYRTSIISYLALRYNISIIYNAVVVLYSSGAFIAMKHLHCIAVYFSCNCFTVIHRIPLEGREYNHNNLKRNYMTCCILIKFNLQAKFMTLKNDDWHILYVLHFINTSYIKPHPGCCMCTFALQDL